MNINQIISRALNRAGLSVNDYGYRETAKDFLQEIIDEHWEAKKWTFRKKAYSITTVSATDEYGLNKLVRVQNIVPNTMRGSDPVRKLNFEPSHEFFKRRPYSLESSDPYYFRDGELRGFSTDPSSASVITFSSSLTNYTTGTLSVVKGSKRVVITTGVVSVDKIGQYIRVDGDSKAYLIERIEHNSTSVFYISEPYEGANDATASFTMGDIGQKATVLGYVSGQLQEEEVQLNGSTSVNTSKSFTSLVRVSKSGKTHGYISVTSNSAAVTNAVLDPGETEIDVQTIKLYPIPDAAETINYEAYGKHPVLYKDSDSPLFPSEWHNLLVLDLYIRLESEWNKNTIPQDVYDRRTNIFESLYTSDNDTDNWTMQVENFEDGDRHRINNLPTTYDDDGFY